MKKKSFLIVNYIILIIAVLFFNISHVYAKEINIDEVLNSKSYSSLSPIVKEFIRNYYEENGVVLLTKDLAKPEEIYLNPRFIEYLESDEKDRYGVIPSVTVFVPNYNQTNSLTEFNRNGIITRNKKGGITKSESSFPSKFDLRDVDGKNFVTPNKNQGQEGLCWAYAAASLLETHDLITKNKSYDNSAILFSEKQMDYALSSDGIIGGNMIFDEQRELTNGASLNSISRILSKRLGGVQDTWNTVNYNQINNNQPLDPYIVFDQGEALYEIDEAIFLQNINNDLSNQELNERIINEIKKAVYNNGGAIVSINPSHVFSNVLTSDYTSVISQENKSRQHALHLIGWDDNYEYVYCRVEYDGLYVGERDAKIDSNTGQIYCEIPEELLGIKPTVEKMSGKGAWILKNSWGNQYDYVYLSYDSVIDDVLIVTKYSEKNWDYGISTKVNYKYDSNDYTYKQQHYINNVVNSEYVVKLKIESLKPGNISLYFSEDGNPDNLVFFDNYSFDYAGIKSIDLAGRNIQINNNSYFQTDNNANISLSLFTKKNDNNPAAYTTDFEYDVDTAIGVGGEELQIRIQTALRNVNDKEVINYQIKKENGEYLPTNAYVISNNKSYYNIVTPIIKLKEEYAKKGKYYIDTLYNNQILYTSLIDLKNDYASITGAGTEEDPWQITNIRQFNMIRNNLDGNFILMNDLDFEYDTQNENGQFYNSGNGWEAIDYFNGNLDGNNKTIRNLRTSSGLFGYITVHRDSCKFEKCGVHDLKVDKLNYTVKNSGQFSGNGGIINCMLIHTTYKYDFNNLSVKDIVFDYDENVMSKTENIPVRIGGIIGTIKLFQNQGNVVSILKVDNWYSDYYLKETSYKEYKTLNYVGGLVGEIEMHGGPMLYINNMKTTAMFDISNDSDTQFYISDLIGHYISNNNLKVSRAIINNTISNIEYKYNDNSRIYSNAFVGHAEGDETGLLKINGAKSTFDYVASDLIDVNNCETGLKPYNLARANYTNIQDYYEDQYYVYDEQKNNTKKVSFQDRFNIYSDKIPTLKKYPEEYSEYYKNYVIRVNEEKNIIDLISKDTKYRKLKVYKSFNCNLDICNSITDETIISVPTEENGNKFKGLKSGSTTLIIYDELSGYLNTIVINVLASDEYKLFLEYNDESLINEVLKIKNNSPYGLLPIPERDGYLFLGWFTDKINGQEIKPDTIYKGNTDVTLYAHWLKKEYTISFNSDGGSSVASQTINEGEKATKPTNPTKTGYTFKEWQLNGSTYDFNTAVRSNITLKAVWTANQYTVTFNSDGGSSVASQTINYNEVALKPNNPTRDGYVFKEWQLNGNPYDFSTLVLSDITLIATWDKLDIIIEDTLKDILEDNGYSVNSGYTFKFTLGDSIATIKNKLGNDVIIESKTNIISTGTIIKKGNESYTVVIKGDLNGDGKVNSADLLQMRKYLLEEVNLTGAHKEAGIIESNKEIKSLDLLRLRQYLLDEYTFK